MPFPSVELTGRPKVDYQPVDTRNFGDEEDFHDNLPFTNTDTDHDEIEDDFDFDFDVTELATMKTLEDSKHAVDRKKFVCRLSFFVALVLVGLSLGVYRFVVGGR